ncbi:flagellar assembly peptidoglycan hydrolase FlgJ [Xylophilus sp. GW821-FHT01B05]
MLRADATATASLIAEETQRIALPLKGGGSQGFGALYSELKTQIAGYITSGQDEGQALSAFTLDVQARSLRAREQLSALSARPASEEIGSVVDSQGDFLARIAPWAHEAAQSLGVSADLVSAHAALESGWGRRPLRHADGTDSHNLFGIKAGAGWQGGVAEVLTTEFEQGASVKKTEGFRSYPDEASAFRDYARLLSSKPAYRAALQAGDDAQAFAKGLAQGGYATDPDYAAKLARVARQLRTRAGD